MANIIEIRDFQASALDVYGRLSEPQLLHYYEPEAGIFIGESPKVIERGLRAGYEPLSFLAAPEQLRGEAAALIAGCGEVPVYTAAPEILTQLTGFHLTRGVLCAMRRRKLPTIEEVCTGCRRIVVLENVMNPANIGSIFRSAAALHMDAILLTPGCSDPLYRRAARVSMGTVFQIPWTYFDGRQMEWPREGMQELQRLGFRTVAMALREDASSIRNPALKAEEKLAIVLGTEGDGLAGETIADCDYTVRIDMANGVDSLNVNAAAAVAFWELA